MLAELLLCGIASMDVGLKTAANSNQFFIKDSSSIHESLIDEKENNVLMSVSNLPSDDWYLSNRILIKNHGFSEKNNLENNFAYGAQTISPEYDIQNDFENCDGYKTNLDGSLNGNDTDFYHFELFGNANIKITYSGPIANNIKVFEFNTADGDYKEKTRSEGESSSDLSVETYLYAGSYCFSVSGYCYSGSGDYDINFDVKYDLISDVSIGEMVYSYGLEGTNWVSDFDPLDVEAFSTKDKTVTVQDSKYNKSLEKNLVNHEKVLQSSLYLWGDDGINFARDFLSQLIEKAKEHIKDAENEKLAYETEQARIERDRGIAKLVISGVMLFASAALTFATAGAATPAILGLRGAYEAIKNSSQAAEATLLAVDTVLYLGDVAETATADAASAKKMAQSLVYENKIMNAREMLDYLEDTRDGLTIVYDANQHTAHTTGLEGVKHVANIKSYYDVDYDTGSEELTVKRVKEFNAEEVIYQPNMIPAYPEDAYMRGSFYGIKKQQDIQDAQKHIKHEYSLRDIEQSEIDELECPGSTPDIALEGRANWFYFDAPSKGTYLIGSGGGDREKPLETQTIVCELFGKPVNGRSEDGVILSDDSTGNKGNFRLHYFMEAGERVYLRIRGKSWDDVSRTFSIHIFKVTSPDEEEWNEVGTYLEDDISFHFGANSWKTMTFEKGGYKTFQCYSNDLEGSMKLCNYRGQTIAESSNAGAAYACNGFLTAEVNPFELYFLQVVSPSKYEADDRNVKISVASVDTKYSTIDDLEKFDSDDFDCWIDHKVSQGEVFLAILTPDLVAHYKVETYSSEKINIDFYDTYTGENVTKFYKTQYYWQWSVACLEANHEYLLVLSYQNPNLDSMYIEFTMDYYSDYEIVIPEPANPIKLSRYFESQVNLNAYGTWDFWVSFDTDGFRQFQLFGNCSYGVILQIYDLRNNLIAIDNTKDKAGKNAYISLDTVANEPYRIRVHNDFSGSITFKLAITPVLNDYELFEDMEPFYSNRQGNGNRQSRVTNYCNSGVGYFVAPETGYYNFSMIDDYQYVDTYLYVIDISSNAKIEEGKDYSDDAYHDDEAKIVRKLEKGKTYYIILSRSSLTLESCPTPYSFYLDVCITSCGDELFDARDNGGYSNTLYFDGNYSTTGVFVPSRTGCVEFDTSENTNFSESLSVQVCNLDDCDYITGSSQTEVYYKEIGNKSVSTYYLQKGLRYLVSLNSGIETNIEAKLHILSCDPPKKTENITVPASGWRCDDAGRYLERVAYLLPTQTVEYSVNFETAGTKIIQTFGNKDTYMKIYRANGSLLASDDNSGYGSNAFIKINALTNTTYKIVVSFKNASNFGEVKTLITPLYDGYSWFNTYDNISNSDIGNSYSTWLTIRKNCSTIMTVTVNSYGKYSFYLTRGANMIDSYLYVLDPNSTVAVSDNDKSNTIWNDDANPVNSTDRSAKVTRYLSKGVKYYVVCTQYDITANSGDVSLQIQKL